MRYRRIEDYALIGDTHSAGLVSITGSIDWMCLPQFDSHACFAAMLDADRGGRWSIAPAGEPVAASRRYRANSMILETTFSEAGNVAVLTDCMAVEDAPGTRAPEKLRTLDVVVRLVHGLEGTSVFEMDFSPRFDFGSIAPWVRRTSSGIACIGGADALDLSGNIPMEIEGDSVRARFEVRAGETAAFVAAYRPSHHPPSGYLADAGPDLVEATDRYWCDWLDRCTYQGEWREEVLRSLLTLKALTYSPTGGIVAAPTTSLPEKIGGVRNWDYRYCWLRDATFTLDIFLQQGFTEEAEAWRDWLLRAVAGDPEDARIMYGIFGNRRLTELELSWLEGYEASAPVRIGNAAVEQFQLDVFGEVMDTFHQSRRAGIGPMAEAWDLQRKLVEFVCERWTEPDEGIWEVRSGPQHFVHSKVMAWVAVDRAVDAVERYGLEGPVDHWREVREAIRADVYAKGIDATRGCFVRSYGVSDVDANLLMLPLVGFVDAADPLMAATVRAIEEDLVVHGFVRRYSTTEVDDGLPGDEGTFLLCTFWLADCLWLAGRREEARVIFERLVALANDVGLLAEQYDPVARRFTGNFPQAFSHVALITTAMTLAGRRDSPAVTRGGRSS